MSAAISGSTAVVGACLDPPAGSAYLCDTNAGRQIAKLLPDDGKSGGRKAIADPSHVLLQESLPPTTYDCELWGYAREHSGNLEDRTVCTSNLAVRDTIVAMIGGVLAGLGSCASALADGSPDVVWASGGYGLPVSGVDFSPDGILAGSASHDGTLKIWNVADAADG